MPILPIVTVASTDQEMEQVFFIRREVFVKEQNVPEAEEYDGHENNCTHLLAWVNGIAVGTARIRTTINGKKLERFAVLKESRGLHVGHALVNKAIEITQSEPYVYMHAQTHAVPFYEKYGFKQKGELFYECDIPHYKMIRI